MCSWDEPLYQSLRELRLKIANEQGVPAYVIFPNSTLQEMTRARPQTENDMRYISGVGEQKLKRYGTAFLDEIKRHPLPKIMNNHLSETVNETLYEFTLGKDVESIALHRGIKESTVYGHFAEAIAADLLDPRDVLTIDDNEYRRILDSMELLGCIKNGKLKPVFDALDKRYDYNVLKCVLASLQ